jgi:hypothetical protein
MSMRVVYTSVLAAFALDACGGVTVEHVWKDSDAGTGGTGGRASKSSSQGGGIVRREPGSGYCGDGVRNGDEACDGSDFDNETCRTVTLASSSGGYLRCTSRCMIDITGCTYANTGGYAGTAGMIGIGGMLGTGARNSGGTGGTGGVPPNTGATPGSSIGDPHVMTLDGLKYDFQAVGEFILIEDRDDPRFVIQIRQAPFLNFSTVSVNTAVAASVAGDRVAFYAGSDPRVDGEPQRIVGTTKLPHGGGLVNEEGTYTLTWPTGEELVVSTTWNILVNVTYRPSDKRPRRHVRGLLGTHDSTVKNDLTTRWGKRLRLPSSPENLYRVFGQSFRIKDAESLFDYSPGEATATFTDRSFPPLGAKPPAPRAADVARARDVCTGAGVGTDALEACAIDVAITGNEGFAKAAATKKRP